MLADVQPDARSEAEAVAVAEGRPPRRPRINQIPGARWKLRRKRNSPHRTTFSRMPGAMRKLWRKWTGIVSPVRRSAPGHGRSCASGAWEIQLSLKHQDAPRIVDRPRLEAAKETLPQQRFTRNWRGTSSYIL